MEPWTRKTWVEHICNILCSQFLPSNDGDDNICISGLWLSLYGTMSVKMSSVEKVEYSMNGVIKNRMDSRGHPN